MDQFITLSVELTTMIVFVVTCNSKSTLPKKKKNKKVKTQFPKAIGIEPGKRGGRKRRARRGRDRRWRCEGHGGVW